MAEELGKSEAEISKWLSGNHNFTLRSISKIETVLNDIIIEIPKQEASFSNVRKYHNNRSRKVTYEVIIESKSTKKIY